MRKLGSQRHEIICQKITLLVGRKIGTGNQVCLIPKLVFFLLWGEVAASPPPSLPTSLPPLLPSHLHLPPPLPPPPLLTLFVIITGFFTPKECLAPLERVAGSLPFATQHVPRGPMPTFLNPCPMSVSASWLEASWKQVCLVHQCFPPCPMHAWGRLGVP